MKESLAPWASLSTPLNQRLSPTWIFRIQTWPLLMQALIS